MHTRRNSLLRSTIALVCVVVLIILSINEIRINEAVGKEAIVCASTCPAMLCDGGSAECYEIPCCDSSTLPCGGAGSEVFHVTCYESRNPEW